MSATVLVEPCLLEATHITSRWGSHPCDYATYKSLKRLNYLVERARKRAGVQYRYDRKTVHFNGNRPDAPLAYAKVYARNRRGWRLDLGFVATEAQVMYRQARKPSPTPVPLFTPAQVAMALELLGKLESWFD